MQIQAAVFREPGVPFSIETLNLGSPRKGEVLVKVKAVGVCHSDWHLMTGATKHPVPVVPGHEGAGIVTEVGEGVKGLEVGDHVALNWAPACGSCFYCDRARPNLCATYVEPIWAGTMLDGTTRLKTAEGNPVFHFSALACFAEHCVVPEQCCVTIPKDIPLEIAALIGCAVTTGVGSVLNTAQVEPGSTVVVFGVGGVGLSTVLGAKLAGAAKIIAVDPLKSRLDLARDLGATETLLAHEDVVSQVKSLTEGRGADYVFEAAGVPYVQEMCLNAARPGGTIVFSGISPMGSATNLPGSVIVRQEKTIKGSYYGTAHAPRDFVKYAQAFSDGKLALDKLITNRYPLEQINEAYADMLSGRSARGMIVFP